MKEKRTIEVLAIEDDPFFIAVFKHYGENMRRLKLCVYHTISLEDALSFLDGHPQIELIFLDYRIRSKITGLEILQHLRAKGVKLPVIVITGSGNEEIAVLMMKAGASDYLVKGSLNAEALERSVEDSLGRQARFHDIPDKARLDLLKDMAIRASLNALCISDLEGVVSYVNPCFVKTWGYTDQKEVQGRKFSEFLDPPEKFSEIMGALKVRRSWLGDLVGTKKDGTKVYLEALFSLSEQQGQAYGQTLASFIDITRVKEEEAKRDNLYKGIMEVFALRAEAVGNVETAGHTRRIAAYTRFIAQELKKIKIFEDYIDEQYTSDLGYASMLHDVGKWRTPNEILLKPSQLTEAEWKVIKQHPVLGVEMLTPLLKDKGDSQYLKLIESVVLYHHERWDGSGYPEGLKGEEIPLSARIVALADVYDALTSERSYRKALAHEEAVAVIKTEEEKFDPRIFKIFIDHQLEFRKVRTTTQ